MKSITTYLIPLFLLSSCVQMTQKVSMPLNDINGSFEIIKEGIPVNWLFYQPKLANSYKLTLDTVDYAHGTQSLRFDVTAVDSTRLIPYPGFTNEFTEVGKFHGEGWYEVSLWIKSSGASYKLKAGDVSAKQGNMNNFVASTKAHRWEHITRNIHIDNDRWLRMDLRITSPGSVWIDDIRITKTE